MKMLPWVSLVPLLVAVTVSGCGGASDTSSIPTSAEDTPAPASASDATEDAAATTSTAAPESTPSSNSVASTNPTSATTATSVDYTEADYAVWSQRHTPEFPYYNLTSGNVNVRSGPSESTTVIHTLTPNGFAGYIQTCNTALDWCQFEFEQGEGWVSISLLSAAPDGIDPNGTGTVGTQPANAYCEVWGLNTMTPRFEGDCIFSQTGGDGSFSIESPSGLIDGSSLISVTMIAPDQAEVRGLTVDGINSRWGEATRVDSDPACWAGSDFTVCAR